MKNLMDKIVIFLAMVGLWVGVYCTWGMAILVNPWFSVIAIPATAIAGYLTIVAVKDYLL